MTPDATTMLPLYEAKMIHHYDHRWATYEPDGTVRDVTLAEKQDPEFVVMPRYWVDEREVAAKLDGRWDRDWVLGWRRIARSTDERTFIDTSLGRVAIGDSIFLLLPGAAETPALIEAVTGSFVFDYVVRQKIGGTNTNFFMVEQLPIPHPDALESIRRMLAPTGAVESLISSIKDPTTAPEHAATIRAELDSACFHLYGIERDDVDYIMDTFPIVKRKDEAAFGEYRTKRLILEAYDRMGGH